MRQRPEKQSQTIYYFICFPLLLLFFITRKITGLSKYIFQQVSLPCQRKNCSSIWRNTLVHILLDTMANYTVFSTMITNNISSNPIPHMVVLFLLVPIHWQEKCEEIWRTRGQKEMIKLQAERKYKIGWYPEYLLIFTA